MDKTPTIRKGNEVIYSRTNALGEKTIIGWGKFLGWGKDEDGDRIGEVQLHGRDTVNWGYPHQFRRA